MRSTRYLAAGLIAFGLAACGGNSPTGSDAGASPRFDAKGGVMYGSGNASGGSLMNSNDPPPPPPPGDSTNIIGGGWIGSGT